MVRRIESLIAVVDRAPERPFARVRAFVFFEVTFRCEKFWTTIVAAVERLAIVQPLMSDQSIARVKRLIAFVLITNERLFLGVHSRMDAQAVTGQEFFLAVCFFAFERQLTGSVRFEVRPQISGGRVGAIAVRVGALVPFDRLAGVYRLTVGQAI